MVETEHKYDVDNDFVLPDLAGIEDVAEVSDPAVHLLQATYFDTPDHRLAAAGVSLRRRTGGDDAGWHLKLPSAIDPDARHEVRVGLGRAVHTVPKRLRSTVVGLAGDQALSPVATITTRRSVLRLLGTEGVVLAEVADDAVEAVLLIEGEPAPEDEGTAPPTTWREVEVELGEGAPELLVRVGERLARAGARRTTRRSKLGDLLGGSTVGPVAPQRGKDAVQSLVQHRLAGQLDALRRREPLARENLPEGVHTMRVAVRRLRSVLATGRPFLDRSVTDPLRDELGWLSDALGEARDAEVRATRLGAAIDALVEERAEIDWDTARVRSALQSPLAARQEPAIANLREVFASRRYPALLDRLRELVADPPWTDRAAERIGDAYTRRLAHDLTRVERRMRAATDPALPQDERAHALHQARKAAKRARYAAEALEPVYGGRARKLTKRLKKLQSRLGQHQDTVVTRSYLLELCRSGRAPLEPGAAMLAGALVERESRAAERYQHRSVKAWSKVQVSSWPP